MDDKTLQKKLNQLARLAEELRKEATLRYGPEGSLFYESEGTFHIMDGDVDDGHAAERKEHVRFSSETFCCMGCGAW